MTINQARNWLGIFFLGMTVALGAYIILFQETRALPVSGKDATSAFQIIIPTLVAQLTIAFRWIANPPQDKGKGISLPKWAVIGPPVSVGVVLIGTFALLIADGGASLDGGAILKNAVTFCVSILSATSVFIIARVFGGAAVAAQQQNVGPKGAPAEG
jgi:hypothetical protein